MGVKDLWKVLEPVKQKVPSADLKGQTLAVDLSLWVCEAEGVAEMRGKVVKPYLRNLFFRVSHLTQAGVHLVFVIDGEAPDLKIQEMVRRQQARFPGKNIGRGKASAKTASRSHFKALLRECCEMLDYMGIPYIQSVGEAEALAALLNKEGLVDGVITNDGDAFLYGARTVCRNFSMNKQDSHVEMYRLSDIERELSLDREKLVSLGLFLGCDYAPKGIPGVGYSTALKYLAQLHNHSVMDRLWEWPSVRFEPLCQVEEQIRKKALTLPVFPNPKVVNEFMKPKDKIPRQQATVAKRPKMFTIQKFLTVKLEWECEYALEKILPLVTFYDLHSIKTGSENTKQLKPHRIVKSRVRHFVSVYEIEWYKDERDDLTAGQYYTTLEDQSLFQVCYPQLVQQFTEEQEKKGKKPRKTKARMDEQTEEVAMVTQMESLSIDMKETLDEKQVKSASTSENSYGNPVKSVKKPTLSVKKLQDRKSSVGKSAISVQIKKKTGLEAVLGEIQNLPDIRHTETVTKATEDEDSEEEEMLPLSQRLVRKVKESATSTGSTSTSTDESKAAARSGNVVSCSELVNALSSDSEDELNNDVFNEKGPYYRNVSRNPPVLSAKTGSGFSFSSSEEDESVTEQSKVNNKFDDSECSMLLKTNSSRKIAPKVTKFSFDDSSDISLLEPSLAHQIGRMSLCEAIEDTGHNKVNNDSAAELTDVSATWKAADVNEEANFSLGLTFNLSNSLLDSSCNKPTTEEATEQNDVHSDASVRKTSKTVTNEEFKLPMGSIDEAEQTIVILGSKSSSRSDSIEKCRESALDASYASLDCSVFMPLDVTLTSRSKRETDTMNNDSPERSLSQRKIDQTLVVYRKTEVIPCRKEDVLYVGDTNGQDIDATTVFVNNNLTNEFDLTVAIEKDNLDLTETQCFGNDDCTMALGCCQGDQTVVVHAETKLTFQGESKTPQDSGMDSDENEVTIVVPRTNCQSGFNHGSNVRNDLQESYDKTLIDSNEMKQTFSIIDDLIVSEVRKGKVAVTETITENEQLMLEDIVDKTILVNKIQIGRVPTEILEETVRVSELHLVSRGQWVSDSEQGADSTLGETRQASSMDETLKQVNLIDETIPINEPLKKIALVDETIMLGQGLKQGDSVDETVMVSDSSDRLASSDETITLNGKPDRIISVDKTICIDDSLKGIASTGDTLVFKDETICIGNSLKGITSTDDTLVVGSSSVGHTDKDLKYVKSVHDASDGDTLLISRPLGSRELYKPRAEGSEFDTVCLNVASPPVPRQLGEHCVSMACTNVATTCNSESLYLDDTINIDPLSESIISYAPSLKAVNHGNKSKVPSLYSAVGSLEKDQNESETKTIAKDFETFANEVAFNKSIEDHKGANEEAVVYDLSRKDSSTILASKAGCDLSLPGNAVSNDMPKTLQEVAKPENSSENSPDYNCESKIVKTRSSISETSSSEYVKQQLSTEDENDGISGVTCTSTETLGHVVQLPVVVGRKPTMEQGGRGETPDAMKCDTSLVDLTVNTPIARRTRRRQKMSPREPVTRANGSIAVTETAVKARSFAKVTSSTIEATYTSGTETTTLVPTQNARKSKPVAKITGVGRKPETLTKAKYTAKATSAMDNTETVSKAKTCVKTMRNSVVTDTYGKTKLYAKTTSSTMNTTETSSKEKPIAKTRRSLIAKETSSKANSTHKACVKDCADDVVVLEPCEGTQSETSRRRLTRSTLHHSNKADVTAVKSRADNTASLKNKSEPAVNLHGVKSTGKVSGAKAAIMGSRLSVRGKKVDPEPVTVCGIDSGHCNSMKTRNATDTYRKLRQVNTRQPVEVCKVIIVSDSLVHWRATRSRRQRVGKVADSPEEVIVID